MSKLTLPEGQDNVIVRNQEVYGFLPKDVIDRLGDTSLQLTTEDQTALGAINEIKSNLTNNVTFDYYEKSGTTDNRGLLLITGLPYNYIPLYVENFSLVTIFFNGSGSTYSPYVQIKNYDNTYFTNQYVTLKIRCMVVDGLETPT